MGMGVWVGGIQSPLPTTLLPCPASLQAARWVEVLSFVKKPTRILLGTWAGSGLLLLPRALLDSNLVKSVTCKRTVRENQIEKINLDIPQILRS